jgi:hypothetical protein
MCASSGDAADGSPAGGGAAPLRAKIPALLYFLGVLVSVYSALTQSFLRALS